MAIVSCTHGVDKQLYLLYYGLSFALSSALDEELRGHGGQQMLTLTRKPGESIFIGDHIEVLVKEVRGGAIRLGIEAPTNVFIYRGELYRRLKAEGRLHNATQRQVAQALRDGQLQDDASVGDVLSSRDRGY